MSNINAGQKVQTILNRCLKAAALCKLGDLLAEVVTRFNATITNSQQRVISKVGLAINAGGATFAKASNAFVAIAGGVMLYKPAATAMPALVGTIAAGQVAIWPFYIDSTGTITTGAKTADAATTAAAILLLPTPAAGLTMLGFIVVSNGSGAGFIGGTTALDAASITVGYIDVEGSAPSNSLTALGSMLDLESRGS